jgi:hypothetical protein
LEALFQIEHPSLHRAEALETEMHIWRPHLLDLDLVLPGMTGVGAWGERLGVGSRKYRFFYKTQEAQCEP